MPTSKDDPNSILFANREGQFEQIQEIIADGLEGEYADRVPALIDLMNSGEPYHQLLACMMLTSWGHSEGFLQVIDWANHFEQTPWYLTPVSNDRISGADSAFQMLANAISTSRYADKSELLTKLRINAVKALLKIYPTTFFDNSLAIAIFSDLKDLLPAIQNEVCEAIDASFDRLSKETEIEFDLPLQIASLLEVHQCFDEQTTVTYALYLIQEYSSNSRMLRELISTLGNGTSYQTLNILQILQERNDPALEKSIQKALNLREKEIARHS